MLEKALEYARSGLSIFPIKPNSKHPATLNGFKDATTSKDDIKLYFNQNSEYNIAMPTGTINGVIVLDIDPKNGGLESLSELINEHPEIENTKIIETPSGGYHFYFRANETIPNKANVRPGVDIRGDGGYVLIPPSQIDGNEYKNYKDSKPLQVPDWLKELTQEKKLTEYYGNSDGEIIEGNRNNFLTQLAGSMRRKGFGETAIHEALKAENEARVNPPLGEVEVERIASSVSRYEPSHEPSSLKRASEYINGNGAYSNGYGSTANVQTEVLKKADQYVDEMFSYLKDKNQINGQPVSIEGINDLLGGGLRRGEVPVLCATGKTGKSSLIHQLISDLLTASVAVGYASREMSPDREVIPNILSIKKAENTFKVEIDDKKEKNYRNEIESWPLYFADGQGQFDREAFIRWVKDAKEQGVEYFFVDHLHKLLMEESWEEASEYVRLIKQVALQENVCIFTIIQPKNVENNDLESAGLAALRGGSRIGQEIDAMFVMSREKNQNNISKLNLVAARSKLAKTGEIYIQYDPQTFKFTEVEKSTVEQINPEESNGSKYSVEDLKAKLNGKTLS